MNTIQKEDLYITSHDGFTLHVGRWSLASPQARPKGLLHIIPGLSEYDGRYEKMAHYIVERGFIVVCMDQRGHGKSGFVAEKPISFCNANMDTLTKDIDQVCCAMKNDYGDIPYYMLGISIGSFLLRNYLNQPDARKITATIMCSTGSQPFPVMLLFRALLAIDGIGKRKYQKTRLSNMCFFELPALIIPPKHTQADWLYTDPEYALDYLNDPNTIMAATNHSVKVLINAIIATSKMKRSSINKDMKVLLLFGTQDAISTGKNVPKKTTRVFEKAGFPQVDSITYEGKRHDLLNDKGGQVIWEDICKWIEQNSNPAQSK